MSGGSSPFVLRRLTEVLAACLVFGSSPLYFNMVMSFPRAFLALAAVTVPTVALERSAFGSRRSIPSMKGDKRIEKLQRQGIHVSEGPLGCVIRQESPLEKMAFSFKVTPEEGIVRTHLWDTTKGMHYTFDKSLYRFHGEVGPNARGQPGGVSYLGSKKAGERGKDWAEVESAGVLPFSHLKSKTVETLKAHAPKDFPYVNVYMETEECLQIAEAIMNDPPQGYDPGSDWIVQVHREKADAMKGVLDRMNEKQKREMARK
ncbi:hypothetical protein FOZ60_007597 [Perkinsus olseni]|uniref:Uncharacterized protein n=1 Tax=Perkinsus olseni TaxID=32597 RepID=A0A7J6PGV5_PEROL|nr:hypothetical protein FOZ60_007597 [Perkinsus olseni]